MSDLTERAIAKMAVECQKNDHLVPIEEYLTSICTEDYVAEKILTNGKTLEGAFKEIREIAKKRQVNGCAYIPPEEGYDIIKRYYGITQKKTQKQEEIIDITQFL